MTDRKRAYNQERRASQKKYLKAHPEKRRETCRKWRENNPDKCCEHARAAYKKNPLKARAKRIIEDQIKGGRIVRPNACSRCGSMGDIEGHHPDYSQPEAVVWLCVPCHTAERYGNA